MYDEFLGINYQINGEGIPILFLHGWGQSMQMVNPLIDRWNGCKVLSLDMPGFGKSNQPINHDLSDYMESIAKLLKKLDFIPEVIIGHSYGGKIAYLYYKKYGCKGLVFIAPSLIKPRFNPIIFYKIYKYKIMKKFTKGNLNNYGSNDYKNASDDMKKLLVRATNTYFDKEIKKIKVPTLIYWGINDKTTPLYMAKKLNKKIINSKLIIHPFGDHFAYFQYQDHFTKSVMLFLKENYGL